MEQILAQRSIQQWINLNDEINRKISSHQKSLVPMTLPNGTDQEYQKRLLDADRLRSFRSLITPISNVQWQDEVASTLSTAKQTLSIGTQTDNVSVN